MLARVCERLAYTRVGATLIEGAFIYRQTTVINANLRFEWVGYVRTARDGRVYVCVWARNSTVHNAARQILRQAQTSR